VRLGLRGLAAPRADKVVPAVTRARYLWRGCAVKRLVERDEELGVGEHGHPEPVVRGSVAVVGGHRYVIRRAASGDAGPFGPLVAANGRGDSPR
jgi:hypothetical protein